MFPGKAQIAAAVLLAGLSGCQRAPQQAAADAAAIDAGYVSPPAVTEASAAAGWVTLNGAAAPGAQVRLASPSGEAVTARAGKDGRWRLQLASGGEARIFGLSAESGGRRVQAQGYLLVGPRGEAALLRAGAGALRLDRGAGARIAAVDFDADGGTLVSGWASPGTDVAVRLDGRPIGDARTDGQGRFSYAIPRVSGRIHVIEATGVGFTDQFTLEATPAAPLAAGPLHSQLTEQGLRADWLTPGGGVQSTILAG